MKFFSIISLIILFAISNNVYATGLIEDTLNLRYWPEIYEIENIKINSYKYNFSYLNDIHTTITNADIKVKESVISKYQKWSFSFYDTRAIISDYKLFVFYVNEMFFLLELIDITPKLKSNVEFKNAFLITYRNMRTHYLLLKKALK